MLAKPHRLRTTADFDRVYKQGKCYKTRFFRAYIRKHVKLSPKEGITALPRFGIVASKKTGTAVQRNTAKRILRTIVKEQIPSLHSEFEMVIIAYNTLLDADSNTLKLELEEILTAADLKKRQKS